MNRSNENGIAMILAMFMVLIMSTLGVSLMFTSQTETWSSQNYKMMSQARYAAESAVQAAANHLMYTYIPPNSTNANDPLGPYTYQYVTPVLFGNPQVTLDSDANLSIYPVSAVKTNFHNATVGTVPIDNGSADFKVSAKLVSMENFKDYIGKMVTVQTWDLTGTGSIKGARSGETSVTALLEHPKKPAFGYAAFATHDGCAALSFAGGASTDSYDSRDNNVPPVTDDFGGSVGTNGNLTEVGNTTQINGTLSTPRSGVGNCTANNVTAASLADPSQVAEGLVELAQPITYPIPDPPSPLPPTGNVDFNGGSPCTSVGMLGNPGCSTPGGVITLNPALSTGPVAGQINLADVSMNGGQVVHLKAGNYVMNSYSQNGGAQLVVDSGPVTITIAGVGVTTALKLNGGGIVNTVGGTYDPMNLQFIYGGNQKVVLDGGADTCALIYAPDASVKFAGTQTDFYGAVVSKYVEEMGGSTIHYDRRLGGEAFIVGNWTLSAFNWKKN